MSVEDAKDNPLLPKVNKILDLKIENDDELLDGLKSLSLFFNENTIRNRRNLRSLIEQQGVEIRKSILDEFDVVVKEIEEIGDIVREMNENCIEMSEKLSKTKSQTRDLIQRTTTLQSEGQKLEMKRKVALAFVQKFQMNEEEINILQGDGPVDEKFLQSLERLHEVEDHCRLLLRLPNQTAGVEGLEMISVLTESAYERLYRWNQRCVRQMGGDNCEVGPALCAAVAQLQERPVLLKCVLDEFATARRSACARSFIDALTSSRTSAPIEMHAHDPLRYASDLLACLHQIAASEKEHLRALLRRCIDGGDISDFSTDWLDRVCEGLCRPFKMRMEQLLVSEQETLILYKINHLLKFYKMTLENLLHPESDLCATIDEMQLLSWRLFYSSLKNHSCSLLEKIETPHHTLAPTPAIRQTLRLLEDILTAQDVSMLSTSANKTELHQMLYVLIDPLLQYCTLSASSMGPIEAAVYLCNCLYVCQVALAKFEYTDAKLEQIQGQLDANVDSLVSFQAGFVIRGSGLSVIYELLESGSINDSPLADRVPERNVHKMMVQFDAFLAHPDTLTMPQLALLSSTKLRDLIRRRSNDLIHNSYLKIYAAVKDTASGYSDPDSFMQRTPEQVADLILNC